MLQALGHAMPLDPSCLYTLYYSLESINITVADFDTQLQVRNYCMQITKQIGNFNSRQNAWALAFISTFLSKNTPYLSLSVVKKVFMQLPVC